MEKAAVKKYLTNCFLLTLPILVWNILLAHKLPKAFQPDIFWKDIPAFLTVCENISRVLIFALTLLMPLFIHNSRQKRGFALYITGTLLYFVSWLILIYLPESNWSNTLAGFMAPAYTPFLWLAGIGLVSGEPYLGRLYIKPVYFITIFIFLLFHNYHAMVVYFRTH